MRISLDQLRAKLPWLTIKEDEWHQHPNGGGWVQNTAKVETTVFIDGDAWVYGDAQVYGNARVYGNAWVYSPLYIQGSRGAITTSSHTQITIGCRTHTAEEWLTNYQQIGRNHGYTPDQITEYGLLLGLVAEWLKAKFGKPTAKKATKKATKEPSNAA